MQALKQSKSKPLESFHLTKDRNNSSIDYNEIIQSYMLNDTSKTEDAIKRFKEKNLNRVLFLIFDMNEKKEQNMNQEANLLNAMLIKSPNQNDEYSLYLVYLSECEANLDRFKIFFTDLKSFKVIIHEKKVHKSVNASNLAFALSIMDSLNKEFLTLNENDRKKKFNDFDFGSKNNANNFDKLIIESGFEDFQETKYELSIIFSSLKQILADSKNNYDFSDKNYKKLIQIVNHINFRPEKNENRDFRKETIQFLGKLKKNTLDMDLASLNTYFEENRKEFERELNDLKIKLSKNTKAKGCMNMFLDERSIFLLEISKFSLDLLKMSDFEMIISLFVDRRNQNEPYLFIEDLIILYSKKMSNKYSIDKHIISLIMKIVLQSTNQELMLSFIKIINKLINLPNELELEIVFDHILGNISIVNAHFVVDLCQILNKLENYKSILKYLHYILIEHQNQDLRNKALIILKKVNMPDLSYINELIRIEEKCMDNKNILNDFLQYVNKGNRLSLNCWNILIESMFSNETSLIIKVVVDNDIQKIPESFRNKFKELFQSKNYLSIEKTSILSICKSFLIGNYETLNEFYCKTSLKQLIENDDSVMNDFLDMVQIEYNFNRVIQPEIVSILKKQADKNNNMFATNLLLLIDKKISIIDKAMNPRISIEKRREHLENISNDFKLNPVDSIKLQDLIQNEPELKNIAFKLLVKSSDTNLTSMINFSIIGNSLDDSNYADLTSLIQKDKNADYSSLGQLLTTNIQLTKNSEASLKLIKEISHLSKGFLFVEKNLESLLDIACYSLNSNEKETVFSIIKDKVVQNKIKIDINRWEFLKFQTSGINGKEINSTLIKYVQKGYTISTSLIDHLINILSNKQHKSDHEEISNTLYAIDLKQPLNEQSSQNLSKAIILDKSLINCKNLQFIITNLVCREINIPEINEILSILIDTLAKNLYDMNNIRALKKLVYKSKIVSDTVIDKIIDILSKKEENTSLRIKCAKIIVRTIENKFSKKFEQVLKSVAIESADSNEELKLKQTVFDGLIKIIEKIQLSNQFVNDLNSVLMPRIFTESQPELKCFIEEDQQNNNCLEKFYLLTTLNEIYLKRKEIDRNIFTTFNSNVWRKELLCNQIICQAYDFSEAEEETLDEFQIEIFKENVDLIINKYNNSFEHIATKIMNKQCKYELDLNEINQILSLICSNLNIVRIFDENNSNTFRSSIKLSLLEQKLRESEILFKEDNKHKLLGLLPYKLNLISKIFSKISKKTNINDLIELLTKLFNCGLSLDIKTTFINNDISEHIKTSIIKLNFRIIDKIIQSKLPDYDKFDNSAAINQVLFKFHIQLVKLAINGWSLDNIKQIVNLIDPNKSIENLLNCIILISEYDLREYECNINNKSIINILKSENSKYWLQKINEVAIYKTFEGSFNKNFDQLIREIFDLNKPESSFSILRDKKLINEYNDVINRYERKSELFSNENEIKNWSDSKIKSWAIKVKNEKLSVNKNEKLAVIKRAVELTTNYSPREIQILSAIILLNTENNKGRLAQINTGEGKTTIVAMLAVFKALENFKVDVITSSTELAKPQAEKLEKFYSTFELTVSHNGKDDPIKIKERYKSDVVYGAASDFQGDILRDEYSKMGTRSGRKCEIAIVDEVDSMLIDGKNHIVMLSSPMPAMDHLEPLLASIWIQIETVSRCIVDGKDGRPYYKMIDDSLTEEGKMKQNVPVVLSQIEGTKENFVKNCTEKHMRRLLRDVEHLEGEDKNIPSDYPEIVIPKHLRELVCKSQLKKWIDSAIHAKYRCKEGQHYILKGAKILPVDANNTGVVQTNMHWSNGLHQFLQLKHGCKITAESLTTNFISNVSYFKRYGSNIYGLTGTLGSSHAKELLNEIYEVDSVIIPPFRKKQFKELVPIITETKDEWFKAIVESSLNKLKIQRGVLIITKYINEVDELNRLLVDEYKYDKSKIKLYKTDNDSKVIQDEIKPGEIIIATNIAGRGTDIKADKIEIHGGLHVCVTFLPINERVEHQNFGRTSRTGNKGTGQFIILRTEVGKNQTYYFDDKNELDLFKKSRDKEEEENLKKAKEEIKGVLLKDEVFKQFCNLLDEVNDDSIPNIKILKRSVEERFGIWLKMKENDNNHQDNLKFDDFRNEIIQAKNESRLIKNPYFYILCGNVYLEDKKFKNAIVEYSKAIDLDNHFTVNAYYNRGYARISEYAGEKCLGLEDKTSQENNEIEEAFNDFEKAKKIIENNLEPLLSLIQNASSSEALSEQVKHKITLYGIQKNTIEAAIGIGNGAVKKQIKALEEHKNQEDLAQKDKDSINAQIEQLKSTEKERENGVIKQALEQKRGIKIELVEIDECLPDDQDIDVYEDEIDEYKNNGFIGSFKIQEIKPINWWSVIGVSLLGLAQLVGGAALAVFTLGAGTSFAMGLMTEGVSDLITAVKDGIINRDFSWASYAIQKAISITVSIVCAGIGAIKDIAKTAVAGVKQAASIATKAVNEAVKSGWKIAAKLIGTALAKGVAKELVTQLVNYGIDKTLMPSIHQEVMNRVEKPIQDALLENNYVKLMLELDGKNRNSYYQKLIKDIAFEILNPRNDPDHPLLVIVSGIAKGIACQKIEGLSTILQVSEAMAALNQLNNFVPEFIEKLEIEIKRIYDEEKVEDKLKENKQADISTQKNVIKENDNQMQSSNFAYNQNENIEDQIGKEEASEKQVQLNKEPKTTTNMVSILSKSVSTNICNIVQSKFIAPVTNAGINYGMNKLTSELDKSLMDKVGNYQAERRIEFFQNKDPNNRIPDQFKNGIKNEKAVEKANQIIEDLKNGGQAGLPHLGAISDEIGRPINVYDENGKLVRTIGDKNGIPIDVEYHKPSKDNPNGHWTLPGGEESKFDNSNKNNCLFNVIAQQVQKDPNELRNNTALNMETNKELLANQAHDIIRLEQYKRNALSMGGSGPKQYRIDKDLKIKSDSNFDEQTNFIKGKLSDHFDEIKNMDSETLKRKIEETKEHGYDPKMDYNSLRLHAMKDGSILGGDQNYFTSDVPAVHGDESRGRVRFLWSCDMQKGALKNIKFHGVVDTHSSDVIIHNDEIIYPGNNIKWNQLEQHTKHKPELRNNYLKVKVSNDTNEYIALEKMNTKGNKNNVSTLKKNSAGETFDTRERIKLTELKKLPEEQRKSYVKATNNNEPIYIKKIDKSNTKKK